MIVSKKHECRWISILIVASLKSTTTAFVPQHLDKPKCLKHTKWKFNFEKLNTLEKWCYSCIPSKFYFLVIKKLSFILLLLLLLFQSINCTSHYATPLCAHLNFAWTLHILQLAENYFFSFMKYVSILLLLLLTFAKYVCLLLLCACCHVAKCVRVGNRFPSYKSL